MKEFEFLRHETDRTKKSHACVTLYHKLYDKELKSEIFISSYDKDNHVNMDVDLSFELKFDNNMYKYNYKPTDDSIDMYHRLQRCIPKKHFNLEKEIELVKSLIVLSEHVNHKPININCCDCGKSMKMPKGYVSIPMTKKMCTECSKKMNVHINKISKVIKEIKPIENGMSPLQFDDLLKERGIY